MSQTKAQLVDAVDGSIVAADLASNSVTTAKVVDSAITADKLIFPVANRNLIINGAMQVAQRGTSFSAVQNTFTLDRFKFKRESTAANFTMAQSTTSPDGFAKRLKMTCTAADTSTASNEFVMVRHQIEAQNLQSLGYGTAAAQPSVLSFYVRSSLTGTYNINFLQIDNSNKIYSRTYTINSANTWEKKTISIPADTSGVINDDNGVGLQINFSLILGSTYKGAGVSPTWESYTNDRFGSQHGVNFGSSTSNDWHLTGVQLEVGSVATDFDHRSFGDELLSCQRYYENVKGASYNEGGNEVLVANGFNYQTARCIGNFQFKAEKRARPSVSTDDATEVQVLKTDAGWNSAGGFGGNSNVYCTRIDCTSISGSPMIAGQGAEIRLINDGIIHFAAEL